MRKLRAVIQSRMSSTRLPGKAILPIAGIPIAVLCAKRASNLGVDICVATSTDPSDDVLAKTVENAGIRVVRGSLENVLERFTLAVSDLSDDDIVARLTADNVFPDGLFLQEMLDEFLKRNTYYLGTLSPFNGLPYGVEAEIFTVKFLREAVNSANSNYEREHVTTWMQKKSSDWVYKPSSLEKNLNHLRCTIDSYDDYMRIVSIFNDEIDPVHITWTALSNKLEKISKSTFRVPFNYKNENIISKLALGTAQLGIQNYGIINKTGRPSEMDALDLIQTAFWHGINVIDCARAYEFAEKRIGNALKTLPREQIHIVTKLDPLEWLSEKSGDKEIALGVEHSILNSCFELGLNKLPVVLLHRFDHLRLCNGKIWKALLSCRERGFIGELGVSVYNPEEAINAIDNPDILHLQIPFNIIDWRWKENGFVNLLKKRPDVTVYARSAYLQGVLISPYDSWPGVAKNSAEFCKRIDYLVKEFSLKSRKELCISYMLSNEWIDTTVVGMESLAQLRENLDLFRIKPLSSEFVAQVDNSFHDVPVELLNPSLWR